MGEGIVSGWANWQNAAVSNLKWSCIKVLQAMTWIQHISPSLRGSMTAFARLSSAPVANESSAERQDPGPARSTLPSWHYVTSQPSLQVPPAACLVSLLLKILHTAKGKVSAPLTLIIWTEVRGRGGREGGWRRPDWCAGQKQSPWSRAQPLWCAPREPSAQTKV